MTWYHRGSRVPAVAASTSVSGTTDAYSHSPPYSLPSVALARRRAERGGGCRRERKVAHNSFRRSLVLNDPQRAAPFSIDDGSKAFLCVRVCVRFTLDNCVRRILLLPVLFATPFHKLFPTPVKPRRFAFPIFSFVNLSLFINAQVLGARKKKDFLKS